jgi:hypothetical protein
MVYLEDQYLWSVDVARIWASALRRSPRLHLIAAVPRFPDVQNRLYLDTARLGHGEALAMVHEAGGHRVQVLDVENHQDLPVYVHSKLCVGATSPPYAATSHERAPPNRCRRRGDAAGIRAWEKICLEDPKASPTPVRARSSRVLRSFNVVNEYGQLIRSAITVAGILGNCANNARTCGSTASAFDPRAGRS